MLEISKHITARRTKIIATIGPASESAETLRSLIVAGINLVRINMSHGTVERHAQVIKVWTEIKDRISELAKNILPHRSSAYTMIESGARGSMAQLTQTIGMIGLKSSPSGDIIELPVKSSFKDGVSVLEFFISSHGVRKGLTDTALKTANAGYLTRRLVMLHLDGSAVVFPNSGTPVELNGVQVGFLGTVARHHELGPIALALVKRSTPTDAVLTVEGVTAAQEVIVKGTR